MEEQQQQLQEYEAQLASVQELLRESPGDESLLSLQKDMLELIELTKSTIASSTDEANNATVESVPPPPPPPPPAQDVSLSSNAEQPPSSLGTQGGLGDILPSCNVLDVPSAASTLPANSDNTDQAQQQKKKRKKEEQQALAEFVVPNHLIILDTDTEAEKNKKRRAIKAHKNKWREKKKEVESAQRQSSWKSFQQKKKKSSGIAGSGSGSSIFATQDGINDRVGVISKKQKTEYQSRTRYKTR